MTLPPNLTPTHTEIKTTHSKWQEKRRLKVQLSIRMHYLYFASWGHAASLLQVLLSWLLSTSCKAQTSNVPCQNFLFSLQLTVHHGLMVGHRRSKMKRWRSQRGIHFKSFSVAFWSLAFQCFKFAWTKCYGSENWTEVLLQLEDYFLFNGIKSLLSTLERKKNLIEKILKF